MNNPTSFDDDRETAAKLFAQTMIVVDDEAFQHAAEERPEPVSKLKMPGRTAKATNSIPQVADVTKKNTRADYTLDARQLIEASLDLGIVCSVLRVQKKTRPKTKLIKASKSADIVSLDWEIEGDSGALALDLIVGIVKSDIRQNGRIRLISIYTSERNRTDILKEIRVRLAADCKGVYRVVDDAVTNGSAKIAGSLRIVCLLKAHGIRKTRLVQKPYEVDEKSLPAKLLSEFSKLSDGLLGNAAMATIASVREVTHHVLQTFDGKMDGPYFHHRATIGRPSEAEDYAIDLVLSEIKKTVLRRKIKGLLSEEAIHRNISHHLSGNGGVLTYRGGSKKNPQDLTLNFSESQVQALIALGMAQFVDDKLNAQVPNFKGELKNKVAAGITTLFATDVADAEYQLDRFASMSQMVSHPESHRVLQDDMGATLANGSIVLAPDRTTYMICLQAVCDTVRRQSASPFIFAKLKKLESKDRKPVFVVHAVSGEGYDMLEVDDSAYTNLEYVNFEPDKDLEMILAKKHQGRSGLYFTDKDARVYRWLGTAKGRRSLRAVQSVAQDMGRIGFDEFEPYRV